MCAMTVSTIIMRYDSTTRWCHTTSREAHAARAAVLDERLVGAERERREAVGRMRQAKPGVVGEPTVCALAGTSDFAKGYTGADCYWKA